MLSSSKDSSPRWTSALALIKVALDLDVDAQIRCTIYVAHWSSIGDSRKLLLCVSLILLPMADNGGGWNAPQTLEADQGVLSVDHDEG